MRTKKFLYRYCCRRRSTRRSRNLRLAAAAPGLPIFGKSCGDTSGIWKPGTTRTPGKWIGKFRGTPWGIGSPCRKGGAVSRLRTRGTFSTAKKYPKRRRGHPGPRMGRPWRLSLLLSADSGFRCETCPSAPLSALPADAQRWCGGKRR